jgi:biopolymer transport protein ExbD
MNVTPLIDVLLVLIIVFMLVVVERRPTGLEAQIPRPPNPSDHTIPPPNRTIVIQIRHAKPGADLLAEQAQHPQVMVNEEAVNGIACANDCAIFRHSRGADRLHRSR